MKERRGEKERNTKARDLFASPAGRRYIKRHLFLALIPYTCYLHGEMLHEIGPSEPKCWRGRPRIISKINTSITFFFFFFRGVNKILRKCFKGFGVMMMYCLGLKRYGEKTELSSMVLLWGSSISGHINEDLLQILTLPGALTEASIMENILKALLL